jgi:hypothetical protein
VLCRDDVCEVVELGPSRVYDLLVDEDLRELYTRYLLEPYDLHEPEIQLQDWIEALFKREAGQRRKELQRTLREAEQEGDTARIRVILMEIRDLASRTNVCDFSDSP